MKPTRMGLASIAPAAIYVAVLLVVPFCFLVWLSLTDGSLNGEPGLYLGNYARILTQPIYLDGLLGTVKMGVVVTLITLIIGYPVAYFIAQSGSRFAVLAMLVVILPLFVSVVVRSFGWMVLFGRRGTINQILLSIGITEEPIQFLYTTGAVMVGLVHILSPLMILPIASVLRGIDPASKEAARSLGASALRTFWTVTFPLSLPGVIAGCILVFAHVIAAFVLPALIGSDRVRLMATMIFQQVMVANNVPMGAALAVVLVVMTFILLGIAQFFLRKRYV